MLINLLDNAVKFAPEDSSIVVRGEARANDELRLHVIDEGPGIPPHFHAELFRAFSRQDGQQEGVGLGLAISHGLMQAMGGALTFAPTAHGGSCFTLHLQYSKAGSSETAALPSADASVVSRDVTEVPDCPLVLSTADDTFAMQIEATAQRLGLSCTRIDPGARVPSIITAGRWLLIQDGAVAPCVAPRSSPRYCLRRGGPDDPESLEADTRTLAHDASVNAWRSILQEIVDEHAATGDA